MVLRKTNSPLHCSYRTVVVPVRWFSVVPVSWATAILKRGLCRPTHTSANTKYFFQLNLRSTVSKFIFRTMVCISWSSTREAEPVGEIHTYVYIYMIHIYPFYYKELSCMIVSSWLSESEMCMGKLSGGDHLQDRTPVRMGQNCGPQAKFLFFPWETCF